MRIGEFPRRACVLIGQYACARSSRRAPLEYSVSTRRRRSRLRWAATTPMIGAELAQPGAGCCLTFAKGQTVPSRLIPRVAAHGERWPPRAFESVAGGALAETAHGFSPYLTRRIAVLRFCASGPPRPTKGRFVPRHKPSLRHPLARESIVNLVIRQKQDHLSFTQCIHIDYLSELGARPLSKTALFRRADHGPTDKLTSEQYCLSSRLSASDRSCRVGPLKSRPFRLVVLNPVNNGASPTIGFVGRQLMDDSSSQLTTRAAPSVNDYRERVRRHRPQVALLTETMPANTLQSCGDLLESLSSYSR
jgi:hypothetical protein